MELYLECDYDVKIDYFFFWLLKTLPWNYETNAWPKFAFSANDKEC